MKEIGGYIELDTFTGPMLHENGIKLNCGRNALAYLIEAKNIQKIWMPKFMCRSCSRVLEKYGVAVEYYSIARDLKPRLEKWDGWLYIVNYYGQLSNEYLASLDKNVIVDSCMAYFQMPVPEVDTIYSCRKYFGVADGGILYTDTYLERELPQDESFERMRFLLGRYERSASEFYGEYTKNNRFFANETVKRMSRLTENLLHGIDYEFVCQRRTENFARLHAILQQRNGMELTVPEGAYAYPLYLRDGARVRKELAQRKIYIPTLWPAVFENCNEAELEYDLAKNILPLPVDQRYTAEDMERVAEEVLKCIRS